MILKHDLVSGNKGDIKQYIECLPSFYSWQIGNSFETQVENLLLRDCRFNHIGPITYQGMNEDGIIICAAFVAIINFDV